MNCISNSKLFDSKGLMRKLDLTGQEYGTWTCLEYRGDKKWLCRCICGQEREVATGNLRNGFSSKCRECVSADGYSAAFNDLFARYRQSAKQRNIEFDLNKALANLMFRLPCNYCGTPPSQIWQRPQIFKSLVVYSGIDRVDSSKGYISTNIVPCCKRCNIAKRNFTQADFINHAKQIAAYQEYYGM